MIIGLGEGKRISKNTNLTLSPIIIVWLYTNIIIQKFLRVFIKLKFRALTFWCGMLNCEYFAP